MLYIISKWKVFEMEKKVYKNYFFNLSYQLLAIVLPVITTPYISRTLKVEGVGIFNYSYSIVSICLIIASLGSNMYGQREIAYYQNDKILISYTAIEIFALRLLTTIIVLPIYCLFSFVYKNYTIYLLYMCIYLLANLFDISWLFQGLEEFKKTAIRSIIVKILGVILVFLFVKKPDDLLKYIIILSGSQLVGNLMLWAYLPNVLLKCNIKLLNLKQHLKPILILFVPTASIYIYTYADKILLGILSSTEMVGYYSQPEKIVKLLMTVLTSMGTVLLPHVATLVYSSEIYKIKIKLMDAVAFILLIGWPMTFGLVAISKRFVPWFLGNGYETSIPIMQILAFLIIIIGIASVCGQAVLIPLQKQRIYSISILIGAIVNVLINLILIPLLDAFGAAIGTLAAETTVVVIQYTATRSAIGLNTIELLKRIWKSFLAGVIMGIVLLYIDWKLPDGSSYIPLLVLLGMLIYVILLLVLKDANTMSFIYLLKKKMERGNYCRDE